MEELCFTVKYIPLLLCEAKAAIHSRTPGHTLCVFFRSIVRDDFLTIRSFFKYPPELASQYMHLRTAFLSFLYLPWTVNIFYQPLVLTVPVFHIGNLKKWFFFLFPGICLFHPSSSDSAYLAPHDCFCYPFTLLLSVCATFIFPTCLLSSST